MAPRSMPLGLAVVVVLFLGQALMAQRTPQESSKRESPDKSGSAAKPRLVLDPATPVAVAGRTFFLGVHFDLEQGWHTYWPGQNDSGIPAEIKLKLPKDWTAGSIQWPAPQRYVQEGGIVDHVYHDSVTLIVPVKVPTTASPGIVRIPVDLEWMVCSDGCALGRKSLDFEIEVQPASKADADAKEVPKTPDEGRDRTKKLFEMARSKHPGPWPRNAQDMTATFDGQSLDITIDNATSLAFFPHVNSIPAVDTESDCVVTGKSLHIPMGEPPSSMTPVAGIVAVKRKDTKWTEWYWIELRAPQPPSKTPVK